MSCVVSPSPVQAPVQAVHQTREFFPQAEAVSDTGPCFPFLFGASYLQVRYVPAEDYDCRSGYSSKSSEVLYVIT